ncbi:MAG: lysine--tRNA ligase [Candidatus Woesearchaeota archaeon]
MEENVLIKEMRRKHDELVKLGINPYAYSYDVNSSTKKIKEKYNHLENEEKINDEVKIAGRIISSRKMGKAAFLNLQDQEGNIQIYVRKDDLKDIEWKVFKLLDIGDFIGVNGTIFRTKKGEITIYVKSLTILSKSLRPLPEKYHGIKDAEIKYRKRYLDLIMNPKEKERFILRTKIINCVREFLNSKNFLEVETPVLQVLYGGTNAKPFKTHINVYNMPMYLRVAPELYLKRLMVAGFERVYEIARNFRNEGVDQTHNPEFTMIEWYEAYADYNTMMDRAEEMYKFIAKKLFDKEIIFYNDLEIDISKKWPRIKMIDAIKKYLDLDVENLNEKELNDFVIQNNLQIKGNENFGSLVFAIFDKLVCHKLIEPTWIIDYPKEVSPLAKIHKSDDRFVERFECYIGGKEIGDGWSELISPIEQKNRFKNEQSAMRKGNDEAHPMDDDFIESLEYAMPPAGGIGVGIDRLVMLFTNYWSIRDVIFFPIMKPEKAQ